ncbi:MAG TPA: DUF1569 domain-containing protein [Thermoanaerobaculia bacterium]|jgi:hypothetical protein
MKSLFSPSDRQQILDRLGKLQAGATRQWGKMDSAQMLAHCAAALEVGVGDRVLPHRLIGKIFGPFVKSSLLGEKPFSKNSPTDPTFVVSDTRDFVKEKARLVALVNRFGDAGPSTADGRMHSFFGRLKGDEWGVMMHKHLDHHLRQFEA